MYPINFCFSGIGFRFCYRICGKNIMKTNLTTNGYQSQDMMDIVLSDSKSTHQFLYLSLFLFLYSLPATICIDYKRESHVIRFILSRAKVRILETRIKLDQNSISQIFLFENTITFIICIQITKASFIYKIKLCRH